MQNQPSNVPTAKPKKPRLARRVAASFNRGSEPTNRPLGQLTDAELEILQLVGEGKTNSEIASQLHLRPGTISTHCTQIRRKLKLKSTNALIRYAVCMVEGGKA